MFQKACNERSAELAQADRPITVHRITAVKGRRTQMDVEAAAGHV